MRRTLAFVSSLLAFAAGLASTGPAAFAVPADPQVGGASAGLAPVAHHSAGLEPWQVALMATAGLVVLAAAALGARLTRALRRPASAPATG